MSSVYPDIEIIKHQMEILRRMKIGDDKFIEAYEALKIFVKNYDRFRTWDFERKNPEQKMRMKAMAARQKRRRKSGKYYAGGKP